MIRIEQLTESRVDEVFKLEKICFPYDPWSRESFENELDNNHSYFFVGIDDENDTVIAYAGVWMVCGVGDITNIAVHPDYRREGIGKQLLQFLLAVCVKNNMNEVTLEVRESNIAAQNLYKSEGFENMGVRKRYYQGKEDAIIMTLDVKKRECEINAYFSN